MKVDIISRELIKPSSPTPHDLKTYKLSFLDQLTPTSYFPLILYYSHEHEQTQTNLSYHLKRSLSETLTRFYPLAGRLSSDEASIDCNDLGASYSETRVDSRLADVIECPKLEVLNKFIPYKLSGVGSKVDVDEHLAIQVNFFDCGGMVIGICFSHEAADACTLASFIKAWASTAKGDVHSINPIFNVSSLFRPAEGPGFRSGPREEAARSPVTKRFVFSSAAISALKALVVHDSKNLVNPTRVEVVSALIWKCGMLAKIGVEGGGKGKSMATHVVNLRGRMVPPIDEHTFGNIVQVTSAVDDGEMTELAHLVAKLRVSLKKFDGEYTRKLTGEDGLQVAINNLVEIRNFMSDPVEVFMFSAWSSFPFYEADFGWGKPTWTSIASHGDKNSILLMDSKQDGGMEAWVVMDEKDMDKFEKVPELQSFTMSYQDC